MLSDKQIEDLSQRMNIPLAGCFFKDELPNILKPNEVYIINLQDSETQDGKQNEGTHWTMLYVRKTPNSTIQPIYFDSYGQPPPEIVLKKVKQQFNKYLPHTTKDIQSLMNNACGFYCLALAHFITFSKYRTGNLYEDVDNFIDLFDDLNKSIDWKKNEYILHQFFVSPGSKSNFNSYNVDHSFFDKIIEEDVGKGIDIMKVPVDLKTIN